MATILAISGSLRAKSFNTMLLHAAVAATPAGTTIEVGSIKGIPLYDGDVEAASGLPPAVVALKDRVVAAEGVLLVSPEYNNGIPGVFKNTIDWLSRPATDIARVFGDRPFGVIGATPGRGGTAMAQAGWLPVLRTLGALHYSSGRLQVAGAGKVFDANGALVDDTVRGLLETYMRGFSEFVSKHRRGR
ncbi:MAG: NADPH-dependent reductase [Labilithrix sp.]|nr:NADPH-dependent reductase [Labilithrix sp.]